MKRIKSLPSAAKGIPLLLTKTIPISAKNDIRVQERPDFTIVVEDDEKEFYSVTGQRVYPILYNGSTYLPLRAIGEIMNKDVVWNNSTKTITLSGEFYCN